MADLAHFFSIPTLAARPRRPLARRPPRSLCPRCGFLPAPRPPTAALGHRARTDAELRSSQASTQAKREPMPFGRLGALSVDRPIRCSPPPGLAAAARAKTAVEGWVQCIRPFRERGWPRRDRAVDP
jgi:hypothetical protein